MVDQRLDSLAVVPGGDDGPPWLKAGSALDLHKLIATFRRRLRLFLAIALLVLTVTVVLTMQATPLFTATADLIIDRQQQQVVDAEAVLSGLPADSSTVDTEIEILRSRQLAERVVDALQLTEDPEFNERLNPPGPVASVVGGVTSLFGNAPAPRGADAELTEEQVAREREQVVDAVLDRLGIQRAGLTYVMRVSFTSEDPEKAARIANEFAQRYLLEQLEAKFEATRQANTWLNTRLSELRAELQQAEAEVEQFRSANGLLSASGATLTEQEISSYNQQLAGVRAQQAEAEARLRAARTQLERGSTGENVGEALGSTVVQRLREQRATVSREVANLSARYGPSHPEMIQAQRQLADIDSEIQAEIRRIIANLEAEVQVARERTGSMSGSLSAARGTLAGNNAAAVRLNELERNAESLRALYQSFLNRFQETSAQEGIEESDARVVSQAKVPTGQSSPKVLLNLALGFVLAGMGGLAAVVLAEMLDSGLATADQVERDLGMPALGSVPLLSSVATGAGRNQSPVDFVLANPLSVFTEAVRALRTSVLYSRMGRETRVIALTSALPGEGKTTTAVSLVRVSAQAGSRAIIVDCDLRRRNVNRLLGIEPEAGLIEVLNGTTPLESAIHKDDASGAYVLPLTSQSFTPRDVFGSEAMDQLLARLRASFDIVILDTAPVLAVSDTRVIAAKADATVLLARWRKTPEKAVVNALHVLEQAGAHVGGVALTQVDMNAQAKYGYGDSGYYYSEYKKYYAA